MNVGHFEQISDCWSLEGQPALYYRTAAARARMLQADATTSAVRQYLDKMIAHCERLAGNVEPGVSPRSDRRYAGGRGCRDRDRLQPGFRRTRREGEERRLGAGTRIVKQLQGNLFRCRVAQAAWSPCDDGDRDFLMLFAGPHSAVAASTAARRCPAIAAKRSMA